jgi:tRNA(adenine34) deaminase
MSLTIPHEQLMRAAIAEAQKAVTRGEVPIGAVVALGDEIIAAAFNQPISSVDPTAHAEILALRLAAQAVGNYRLTGATLCVTVEPCVMCVGAVVHARIGTVIFGAREARTGAVRSTMQLLDQPYWNHRMAVIEGVMADDCRALMQEFFQRRRVENAKRGIGTGD